MIQGLFKNPKILIFLGSFTLACFLIFPIWIFQSRLVELVQRQSGIQIVGRTISLGTGLGLGLGRGSVLAIKAEDIVVRTPQGISFTCQKMILAPHILPIFVGKARAAIFCDTGKFGEIVIDVTASPIWSPKQLNAEIDLEDLSLELVNDMLSTVNVYGILKGTANVQLDLSRPGATPEVQWKLSGSGMQLPAVNAVVLNVPPMRLGEITSEGSFSRSKIKIPVLKFGDKNSHMEGDLNIDFGLSSNLMPVSGILAGKIKVDRDFQDNQLKDINLDLLFGSIKNSGFREFSKPIRGSIASLLIPPTEQ